MGIYISFLILFPTCSQKNTVWCGVTTIQPRRNDPTQNERNTTTTTNTTGIQRATAATQYNTCNYVLLIKCSYLIIYLRSRVEDAEEEEVVGLEMFESHTHQPLTDQVRFSLLPLQTHAAKYQDSQQLLANVNSKYFYYTRTRGLFRYCYPKERPQSGRFPIWISVALLHIWFKIPLSFHMVVKDSAIIWKFLFLTRDFDF